ncbi:MAG: regulatory protein RecX [Bacillota bacterium]
MPKDCHDTALSYLEHRERSAYEVMSHLKSKGFQDQEIEDELQSLKELHYVDDERYCEAYIRYGKGKGRGPVRLQFELKEKGIDSGLIQNSLEESFDRSSEKEAALKEASKLLGYQTEPDEKTIAKIGRKLASLGYHTEIIYDVIGQIRKS